MSRLVGKPTMWLPDRSDTNRAVQSQKTARGWKFWIQKLEALYYPCSENKGADQLRSYCEADLRLCFRLCRLLIFPCGGSNINVRKVLGMTDGIQEITDIFFIILLATMPQRKYFLDFQMSQMWPCCPF